MNSPEPTPLMPQSTAATKQTLSARSAVSGVRPGSRSLRSPKSAVASRARPAERRRRECAAGIEEAGGEVGQRIRRARGRSEEHTSELQSLMRISSAVFCLKQKKKQQRQPTITQQS